MLRLLHESDRRERGYPPAPLLQEIRVAGHSFAAFLIEVILPLDALVMLGEGEEDRLTRPPLRCRLFVEAEGYVFDLHPVGRVNGCLDPLLRQRSCEVKGGEPAYFFAVAKTEQKVPASTVHVRLYEATGEGESLLAEAHLPLTPLPYTFAAPQHFVRKMDLWQHNTCIARYYGVEPYSDAHFELLEGYVAALAWLGQKSVTLVAAHTPWDGQRRAIAKEGLTANLFENQMVRIEKTAAGLTFDFSILDRYIALCERHGIADEYEVFGLCGAWTSRTLLRAKEQGRYVFLEEDEVETYIHAFYQHFVEKGYLNKTLVCADEPNDQERFRQDMARIRRLAPGFRFKAALDNPQFADLFDGDLDVIVPSFFTACSRLAQLQNLPIEKTWYICCGPDKPNTFLTSPLLEMRALAYLNGLFGFDGILRWAFTAWTPNPYQEGRVGAWAPGDTYLIYPGQDGQPVLSLRYFQLRRMAEDIQLLYRVKDKRDYLHAIWRIQTPQDIKVENWLVQGDDLYSLYYPDYEACRLAMIRDIGGEA